MATTRGINSDHEDKLRDQLAALDSAKDIADMDLPAPLEAPGGTDLPAPLHRGASDVDLPAPMRGGQARAADSLGDEIDLPMALTDAELPKPMTESHVPEPISLDSELPMAREDKDLPIAREDFADLDLDGPERVHGGGRGVVATRQDE